MLQPTPLAARVALVFGAGSSGPGWGNGKAAAVAYARAGARVACVDLALDRAEETARIIREESGEAIALAADVVSNAEVAAAVNATAAEWGQLDILHNNVGISLFGGPVDLSESDWDRSIDTNLKSVFLACKHALPVMERQGRGVVTNISSILSVRVSWYDQIALLRVQGWRRSSDARGRREICGQGHPRERHPARAHRHAAALRGRGRRPHARRRGADDRDARRGQPDRAGRAPRGISRTSPCSWPRMRRATSTASRCRWMAG